MGQSKTPIIFLQGYTTRDRRSAHVRQADEAAEAGVAAAANEDPAVAAELEGAVSGPASVFKQDSDFKMLVQTARLLLEQSKVTEAKQLLENSIRFFAQYAPILRIMPFDNLSVSYPWTLCPSPGMACGASLV